MNFLGFQAQQKEYQRDAEEARQAREEAVAALRETEKKCHIIESELRTLQDQLDAATIGRRQAEAERDELNDQLRGTNARG